MRVAALLNASYRKRQQIGSKSRLCSRMEIMHAGWAAMTRAIFPRRP